jgi:glycosyltransferase involved in cell wall biosynthesis
MRIGVYTCGISKDAGGMFQAAVNMLVNLYEISQQNKDDYVALVENANIAKELSIPSAWEILECPQEKVTMLDRTRKLLGDGWHRDLWRKIKKRYIPLNMENIDIREINYNLTSLCKSSKLDFIIFPLGSPLPAIDIPYITFVPDLQHKLQAHFPEISDNNGCFYREKNFRNQIKYATSIIVDSETGKNDVLYYYSKYGAKPEQVFILPYQPFCKLKQKISIDEAKLILQKYDLPEQFFFYPAQFWSHKNHLRIVKAVKLIKERFNINISLVFTGSKTTCYREKVFAELMDFCKNNNLENQVIYLGYVSDNELSALYRLAKALIMPTFFGPSNIPVIEAWAMGCPVIYSNIRGLREQAGNSALLVDPNSVPDIADRIIDICNDEELRQRLICNGMKKIAAYSPDDYKTNLQQIINYTKEHYNDINTCK